MDLQYTYNELKAGEIRILHLQPELETGTLKCNLETVALNDSKHKFVAFSWNWGANSEECACINLNGTQFSGVRPSLHQALSALRKDDETIHLWIDAICINQNDPNEKDRQIPLMAEIYTSASEVYIWLGGSADDSDFVMETLRRNREEDYKSSRFIIGLFEMLLRPWWTRTWIVQEYVLNKTSPKIFCGHGTGVSAELLLGVWRRASRSQEAGPVLYPRIVNLPNLSSRYWLYSLRDSRHGPSGEYLACNLQNALSWLKGFEATNPQDKIYGALGLIEPKLREQFVKEFKVNTDQTPGEVYLDATIYLLKCEKSSTIFYDFPIGRHSDLPSWVPNFNLDTTLPVSPIRLGDVTSDHLDIQRENVEIIDRVKLSTRGLLVYQVNELIVVEDHLFWKTDNSGLFNSLFLLHQIQALVDKQLSRQISRSSPEPLWKTLIAGCYGSIKDEELEDEQDCRMRFEEWMAFPLDSFQDHILAITRKYSEAPHIMSKIGHTLWPGRCFFSGEEGTYGISEAGTQKGDIIALLFPDHFVPFILRKIGDHFEMVGTAYIPEPFKEAVIRKYKGGRGILTEFVIE